MGFYRGAQYHLPEEDELSPNILFVFADQLRYSALACNGNHDNLVHLGDLIDHFFYITWKGRSRGGSGTGLLLRLGASEPAPRPLMVR